MARNQLSFFATKSDLESLLRAVEQERSLQFVQAGLFDSPQVEPHGLLRDVPELGKITGNNASLAPGHLVVAKGTRIGVRPIPQRGGGIKYAIDQTINPSSIALRPGGVLTDGLMIAGQLGTVTEDVESLDLYQSFSKHMLHQFTKIKSFYVGREANDLLAKGWRLVANASAPVLYDLKLD